MDAFYFFVATTDTVPVPVAAKSLTSLNKSNLYIDIETDGGAEESRSL